MLGATKSHHVTNEALYSCIATDRFCLQIVNNICIAVTTDCVNYILEDNHDYMPKFHSVNIVSEYGYDVNTEVC